MSQRIIVPSFASEAEEAQWWYDHREETGRALVEASQQGRNGIGSMGRLKKLREAAEAAAQQSQPASTR